MTKKSEVNGIAENYIKLLGGAVNIKEISACTTRLRVILNDLSIVNEEDIKLIGALGVNKLSDNYLQIVVGLKAELFSEAINKILNECRNITTGTR